MDNSSIFIKYSVQFIILQMYMFLDLLYIFGWEQTVIVQHSQSQSDFSFVNKKTLNMSEHLLA